MRLSALAVASCLLAGPVLGCAQVVGIEDISSSAAAQACVETLNQPRQGASLAPVARWTDQEECADQTATATAAKMDNPPDCAAGTQSERAYIVQAEEAVTFLSSE